MGQREPDGSDLLPSRSDAVDDAARDDEVGLGVVVTEDESLLEKPDPGACSAQESDAGKDSGEA